MAAAVVLEIPARVDELVEYRIFNGPLWPDDGCDLAPSCLACPFETCRYEMGNGIQSMRAEQARAAVNAQMNAGARPIEIAQALGISVRTVHRLRSGK